MPRISTIAIILLSFFGLVAAIKSASPLTNRKLETLKFILSANGLPPGNFVVQGNWDYAQLNSPWQLKPPKTHPLAFVLPRDEGEVMATVHWARKLGIRVVAKGGGHSFEKYSYGDSSSLVIDLRLINGIAVNSNSRTATIGPGVLVGPLSWSLWETGRVFIPTGYCPTIGVAGSSLGGGLGNFGGTYGLALDNILELSVVNSMGKLIVANQNVNSDLFWAMRGAGSSFGIVTKFTFRTYPAPDFVFVGTLNYAIGMFPQVMNIWQNFVAADTGPTNVTLEFTVGNATNFELQFTDLSGNDHRFEQIRQLFPIPHDVSKIKFPFPDFLLYQAKVLSNEILRPGTKMDIPSDLARLNHFSSQPVYQKRKSFYVSKIVGESQLFELQSLLERMPSTVAVWFDGYGGAVRALQPNETAFVHRGSTLYNVIASYKVIHPDPFINEAGESYVRHFFDAGREIFQHNETYQNYVDEDLLDYLARYYGDNLARLVQVKRNYDPDNFFRNPQSVPIRL